MQSRIQTIVLLQVACLLGFLCTPLHSGWGATFNTLTPIALFTDSNGGVRGGGDLYAGEFQEIERGILLKIDDWIAKGILKISTDDLEQIKKIQKTHIVTSRPHACLELREDAHGNCINPDDEREVVNDPLSTPRRVIIGRILWDGYRSKPLDKETLTLHEMLEVALTKDHKIFVDKAFENSYATRLSLNKNWEIFKDRLLDSLRVLQRDDHEIELYDLSPVTTFLAGVKKGSDYSNCLKYEGKSPHARAQQDKHCQILSSILEETLQKDVKPVIDKPGYRMQKMYRSDVEPILADSMRNDLPLSWRHLESKLLVKITTARRDLIDEYNSQLDGSIIIQKMERVCPDDHDFTHSIRCFFSNLIPAIEESINTAIGNYTEHVDQIYKAASENLTEMIDPV